MDFESLGNMEKYILKEKTLKLVNLTPHDIVFRASADAEPFLVIPPTSPPARVVVGRQGTEVIKVADGCGIVGKGWQNEKVISPTLIVNKTTFGVIENLPDPEEGTGYIVSRVVAEAAMEEGRDDLYRTDLYIVDDTVRDEKGNVVGARGLARLW